MKNEMIKRRFSVIIVSALIMLSLIIMTSCGRKDENVRIEEHVSKNDNAVSLVFDDIIDTSDSKVEPIEEVNEIRETYTSKNENETIEAGENKKGQVIVDKLGIADDLVAENDESSEAEDISVSQLTLSTTPMAVVGKNESDVDMEGLEPTEVVNNSNDSTGQNKGDVELPATVTVVPTQSVVATVPTRTPETTEKPSEAIQKNSPAAIVKPNMPASEFTPIPTATLTPTVVSTPTQKSTPVPTRVPTKPTTQSATITSTAVVTKVPTAVITKAVTPTATISPTPKATNTPKPTAATKKNSPTPTVHVHNWVDVTKTVHHEAKGYWIEEWDEPVERAVQQCKVCKKTNWELGYLVLAEDGLTMVSNDSNGFDYHCGHCGLENEAGLRGYRSVVIVTRVVHHNPEYVIYSNAYDEVVPGSRCSGCGEEVWAW